MTTSTITNAQDTERTPQGVERAHDTELTNPSYPGEPPSLPTGDASLLFSRIPDIGDPQTCETPPSPEHLPLTGPIHLGPVDQIPFGEGRVFLIADEPIAVFRLRNGQVYAIQALCPHRNGPLIDGLVGGTTVVCPLHAWKFDLTTGKTLFGTCDVQTYPVRLAGGEIVLG